MLARAMRLREGLSGRARYQLLLLRSTVLMRSGLPPNRIRTGTTEAAVSLNSVAGVGGDSTASGTAATASGTAATAADVAADAELNRQLMAAKLAKFHAILQSMEACAPIESLAAAIPRAAVPPICVVRSAPKHSLHFMGFYISASKISPKEAAAAATAAAAPATAPTTAAVAVAAVSTATAGGPTLFYSLFRTDPKLTSAERKALADGTMEHRLVSPALAVDVDAATRR